jgi:outer membrane receptor protein involved in Fe transport
MSSRRRAPRPLVCSVSVAALLAAAGSAVAQTRGADAPLATRPAGGETLEGLVVTAERREARAQDVPMAVTAFSAEDLRARRIDGGRDLLLGAPNVNFARSNFGGYSLSIRGIGSKFIGNSGEYGVSVHENATPMNYNRLADADFFDVERVEVLRGPQGTLYGRNATGGAINIITARPTDRFEGWVRGELANYDSRRFSGAINVPLNEMMAVRWAGFSLKRDGFGRNLTTGGRVDGRDIQASRLTFRLHPDEAIDVNVLWERFDEKDDRSRIGKQLCIPDPGPAVVSGVAVSATNRGLLSQGCLPGSRYSPAAYGAVNTAATLTGMYLPFIGLAAPGSMQAGKIQDSNLLDVESVRDPIYQARENFFQIDAKAALGHGLTFESLTGFNYDRGRSYQDYNRVAATASFAPTGLAAALFPGGVLNDPQLGPSRTLLSFDYYPVHSKEVTQEARLWSDFAGPWNFSAGVFHSGYRIRADYDLFSNGLTAFARFYDAATGVPDTLPFYVDPNSPPSGLGHNYYVNAASTQVTSDALFGELYWRPTAGLKVTGGFRLTRDHKEAQPDPITLLAAPTVAAPPPASGQTANRYFNGGIGHPPAPTLTRSDTAPTGRFNVEWTPDLGFTDRTMVYASFSRGYKGGGFNTPCDPASPGCAGVPATFAPEYVNAYEIGTKNVLAHGAVVLNLTGFHYDYTGYQVSSIINKASVNQNIDAGIDGLELETVWQPTRALRFNLDAGWLRTAIKGGAFIDTLDRTQGNPALAVIKAQDASNCVVNRAALARLLAVQQGAPGAPVVAGVTGAPTALLGACSGALGAFGLYDYAGMNVATAPIVVDNAPLPNSIVRVGQGVPVSLDGRQLPNAPDWTLSFGAQYTWDLAGDLAGWRATLRGDYYRQGESYARIYNTASDKLRGYQQINATLTFLRPASGLEVQLYVKNLTDEQPITNLYLADDSSGLFTNSFTLNPRQFGVAAAKRF